MEIKKDYSDVCFKENGKLIDNPATDDLKK